MRRVLRRRSIDVMTGIGRPFGGKAGPLIASSQRVHWWKSDSKTCE